MTSPATGFADHASNAAMHYYGSGIFSFAQVGISLRSGAPGCKQPLDAAGMTGIRFWAKGTSVPQHLRFMLGTPESTPVEYGGTCITGSYISCWEYPSIRTVVDDQWREYVVPFADMSPPLESSGILTLIWESYQDGPSDQILCFDFWLDDVAFYRDE